MSGDEQASFQVIHGVTDALAAEGVEVVFGVVGAVIDRMMLDWVTRHRRRYIAARHEQGAVHMADGYARATGRVGVAVVAQGPGLTNAATALTAARLSRTPLVVIAADKPAGSRLGNMDIDQPPIILATAGALQPISTPATAAEEIQLAFRHARLGQGPIVLQLSYDVAEQPLPAGWRYEPAERVLPERQAPLPDPRLVAEVAQLAERSERPVILAGRGAIRAGARDALIALADRIGAVLSTTLFARGWFDGHPFNVGLAGGFAPEDARAILNESDLVLAFGAALTHYTLDAGRLFPEATLVQIDTDPAAIGAITRVDRAIIADARATAHALAEALGPGARRGWRSEELALRIAAIDPWREGSFAGSPGYLDRRLVVQIADELLPANRLLVVDIGHFMGLPAAHLRTPHPDDLLFPWRLGAIGTALPEAIGAAVGRPDRLTVLFIGDGGLMMTVAELESAARQRIPLLVICEDDGGYGAERVLFQTRGEPTFLSDFDNPDFAAIAAAMGCRAFNVASAEEYRRVLAGLGTIDGPVFIAVKIDPNQRDPRMERGHQGAGASIRRR
ncbi:MAG: thiamine pyrophosphate-binding protein [Chloroflexota bacterium]|nr:thiamine pyrophosphate-binding protein [Dehalococcoidia bacterium]MDW8253668.1 thiamine pyrophosphate-binding protein [Chloroflexota bacterium]